MDYFHYITGTNSSELDAMQMSARALIVFICGLLMIRIAGIRLIGKQLAFDYLSAIILGGILGRAISDPQHSFWTYLAAAAVVTLLHRFIAWLAFHSRAAGALFKGKALTLYENGEENLDNMQKTRITRADIMEALRRELKSDSLHNIKEVILERSGEISFILKR